MQTKIEKLIGRIDNTYYICDTLFEHADDFKGATATVLLPVTREDYEKRIDPTDFDTMDYFKENWQQAVESGNTIEGLEDYTAIALRSYGDEAVFDLSGYKYWDAIRVIVPKLTEEDYPVFECVGGGRSFSPDMEWDKIYDEKLWKQIKEIETKRD